MHTEAGQLDLCGLVQAGVPIKGSVAQPACELDAELLTEHFFSSFDG